MQTFLDTWFGATGGQIVRYLIAAAVVALLFVAFRWVLRTYLVGSFSRGKANRLAVVEATAIDERRRLVLVRRDGVEHLLLIGGPTDIVVEPTIIKGVPVGTIGRMPGRSTSDGDVGLRRSRSEPVAPVDRAVASMPDMPPAVPVAAAAAVATAAAVPPPVASEAPPVDTLPPAPPPFIEPTPMRPAPRQDPMSTGGERNRPQNQANGGQLRRQQQRRPEPVVVEPRIEPQPAPPPEPVSQDTAPVTAASFEDLARQLDEALRIDIGSPEPVAEPVAEESDRQVIPLPYARPSRGPAAVSAEPEDRPAPIPEVKAERPTPEIKPESATPVIPPASAWLRPRKSQSEPAKAEVKLAEVPAAPVPAPNLTQNAPTPANVSQPEASSASADDLVAALAESLEFETSVPAEAPLPISEEAAPAAEDASEAKGDFTSLEDEMARLLDELAGDSKGKR